MSVTIKNSGLVPPFSVDGIYLHDSNNGCVGMMHTKAFSVVAASALNEKAERENGCVWAAQEDGEGGIEFVFGCTELMSLEILPSFCPNCGKPVTVKDAAK